MFLSMFLLGPGQTLSFDGTLLRAEHVGLDFQVLHCVSFL